MTGQSQINQPFVDGVIVSGFTTVDNQPQKILVVAQKTASGTATAGALVTNVQNDNTVVSGLFGARSMAAGIIRNIRKVNSVTQVDVISLDDDGSGAPATGTITIVGTATEAGTFIVTVGSEQDHQFSISVAIGDTETDVADAITVAVTADTEVPVTAANVAGVETFTAANDGTVGNSIGISISGTVAGITGTAVVAMASGATDPSFTGVFDPVEGIRYQNLAWPYTETAGITVVANFLNPRLNNSGKILDGKAHLSVNDTFSNLETLGDSLNNQNLRIIGDRLVSETNFKANGMFELTYGKSGQSAGIRALRLTDGANIANLVIANVGSLDRFGGIAIASLPYFNTPLQFMPLIDVDHGFTEDEIEDLFDSGISIWGNNLTNTQAIMGEQVSTYKTDAAANPDETFKFGNFDDTARESREFYFNNYKARFNQHRLTTADVEPGRAMANVGTIRRFSNNLFRQLGDNVLAVKGLITSGEGAGLQAQDFYDENLTVTITSATTAIVTMKLKIVTQLRAISYTIEIVTE